MGNFYVGVKAIIMHEKKVLLIKRSEKYKKYGMEGYWDIPGGRISYGEEPIVGLRREIKEEVGLEFDEVIDILDTSNVFCDKDRHIVRITYLCTVKDVNAIVSHEHTEFIWINPNDIDFDVKDKLLKKILTQLL
jgi:8-oxo-dGTP diphosphatase